MGSRRTYSSIITVKSGKPCTGIKKNRKNNEQYERRNKNFLQTLQANQNPQFSPFPSYGLPDTEQQQNPCVLTPQNQMFATQNTQPDPFLMQLMQLMQTIQMLHYQLENLNLSNNNQAQLNNNVTPEGGCQPLAIINPQKEKEFCRYFWTCGCCVYWGKNCPNKKRGHKYEATFRNHM